MYQLLEKCLVKMYEIFFIFNSLKVQIKKDTKDQIC